MRRAVALVVGLLVTTGLAILGASVSLDYHGLADERADLGVALGLLGVLVGITTLFL